MEENKRNEKLDSFTKKYVKEIEVNKTTLNFTASVMDKIILENSKEVVFQPKPLLSKKVWFAISVVVIVLILVPFQSSEKSFLTFSKLNISFFNKVQLADFLEVNTLSNTLFYAIFFFGLMVIAQIIFLKRHFDKSYFQ